MRKAPVLLAVLLAGCATARVQPEPEVVDATSLLRAIEHRYSDQWYRTLYFSQKTTTWVPNQPKPRIETWLEWGKVPGRLRIQMGPAAEGRGAIYARDSLFIVQNHAVVRRQASRNPLLLLGFDIYVQPAERSLALLTEERFDLTKFHTAEWQGKPVYVVGALAGDVHSRQFWVDRESLLFVRLLEPAARDTTRTSDIRFNKYVKAGGGWIAPEVEFYNDGQRVMLEEYSEIRTDMALDDVLFDPDAWRHAVGDNDPPPIEPQQAPRLSRTTLTPGTYAITNVNVIPMTRDTVLRGVTVTVRDGRIAAVGRSAAPAGARTIDGTGRYLMPGLADMHTHLYSDGNVPDSAAPAELGVMLANGVTTARLMIGTPEQITLRQQVERGAVLGPQLWLASPQFTARATENARVVTTPEDVRAAVREQVAAGYDFIKITFGITGALYDALVDEAKKAGIPLVGHVEPAVGVHRALAAGQQIEHLDAYFEAALSDQAPMKASVTQYGIYQPQNWASLDYIDDRKLTELAQATARAGVWTGPTLEIFNRAFSVPLTDEQLRALPDWNMIPNSIRGPYVNSRNRYWAQPVTREQRAKFAAIRNTLVKRIADAGGKIIAGSDSPDLLMAYGFTMHRELQALVAAGLTPYQALAAGTRNPAEYLGALREWGTIEPGKRADLILLAGNPLEDIRNTQRIQAVAIGGRWLERAELDRMIEAGAIAIDGKAR